MELNEIWKVALAQIEVKLDSPAQFKTWFSQTTLLELSDKKAVVGVKNAYTSDWLKRRHNETIHKTLRHVYGKDVTLEYAVDSNLTNEPAPKVSKADYQKETAMLQYDLLSTENPVEQALKRSKINTACSFNNYVVGPSNKLAHAAAMGVARNPGSAYNPLFIYGPTGLGKTHLGQAVGHHILEKDPSKKVLYASSEWFLNDMVKAIRTGKNSQFRQKYRTLDLLIIDDIQFLSKWQETQNEFFNTFNVLHNEKKQIILISDRPPHLIENIEDRMRSRFQGGMTVDISRPDYEMRLAIVQRKSESLALDLPLFQIEFVAKIISDNVRELEGALQKVALYNTMKPEPLSTEEIANILGKDAQSKRQIIKPQQIIKLVSDEFSVSIKDIKGPGRKADVAFARQVCMFLLREDFDYKLDQVAHLLERKDHTTVLHAVDKIKSMYMLDDSFKQQIDLLREKYVG